MLKSEDIDYFVNDNRTTYYIAGNLLRVADRLISQHNEEVVTEAVEMFYREYMDEVER